jgi:protein phosphatase
MNYTFCSQTDPGRIRANNEDAVTVDETAQFAVLADGMGGYNAGEVASGMATALIRSELGNCLSQAGAQPTIGEIKRAVEAIVARANREIFEASVATPHYEGMGTTLVLAVFREQKLLVGHIGDSRCYRLRGNKFLQITKDHSLLQEQLDAGWLTPNQALNSPIRNLVTRALGVAGEVMLELHEHQVLAGDLYLLCSDGLSDMVQDTEIVKILRQRPVSQKMADDLVEKANENGGKDNITVVLAQASGQAEEPRLISNWLWNQ